MGFTYIFGKEQKYLDHFQRRWQKPGNILEKKEHQSGKLYPSHSMILILLFTPSRVPRSESYHQHGFIFQTDIHQAPW